MTKSERLSQNRTGSRGYDVNATAILAIDERATEAYMKACRLVRFGGSPAIREAAKAEALRLRSLVHPA